MRATDYVDIGHYLRDVRESLGISLPHAAHILHIREKYLYGLETGNFEQMPAKAYVRGYIKNYAELLQLNPEEVLSEYIRLFDEEGQKFFIPDNRIEASLPSRSLMTFCIVSLISLYSYWYIALYEPPPSNSIIPEVPTAYMLSRMQEEWKHCLTGNDTLCYLNLRQQYALALPAYIISPTPDTIKK